MKVYISWEWKGEKECFLRTRMKKNQVVRWLIPREKGKKRKETRHRAKNKGKSKAVFSVPQKHNLFPSVCILVLREKLALKKPELFLPEKERGESLFFSHKGKLERWTKARPWNRRWVFSLFLVSVLELFLFFFLCVCGFDLWESDVRRWKFGDRVSTLLVLSLGLLFHKGRNQNFAFCTFCNRIENLLISRQKKEIVFPPILASLHGKQAAFSSSPLFRNRIWDRESSSRS